MQGRRAREGSRELVALLQVHDPGRGRRDTAERSSTASKRVLVEV